MHPQPGGLRSLKVAKINFFINSLVVGAVKFKSLRKQVQTSLALKVNGKKREKEWKRLCNECVKANPEKMTVDKYGKLVSLVK